MTAAGRVRRGPASDRLAAIGLVAVLSSVACAPKVKYVAPSTQPAPTFKENAGGKPAEPADATLRGAWWELFGDAQLNALESQIAISNQTLKAAAARFAEARAAVSGARAALYPQVGVAPSAGVFRPSGNRAVSSFHDTYADFLAPATVSYEPDFWGRLHGTLAENRALAQATAADLETASLSVHAELALDYFMLRGFDRERELLESAVTAYERALELTRNRFTGGLASQADVALAETQLETTRAQSVDIGVARAALEHAIAVLIGQSPSSFSLVQAPLADEPPAIPAGLPSQLLERRPDVAAAERRVAAANAEVGVATSAYYPILELTGAAGVESSSLAKLVSSVSTFWSAAPQLLVTVFDAGRRRAEADQARAAYAQNVATFQQAVLVVFQEVEDQLAALRILDEEATIQRRAVDAAERSLQQATNRYRGGLASYLEVTFAQSVALANERTAVDILTRRMTASVLLIKGLGGGWNVSALPAVTR
jgi:NodT family efflux transporter outer membrane factor (OMF) lipoprotein